ncbi:MAG: GatB/YqeY domain-containing protein, partial [Acidobacteriota bacterium]|nr:GatB/YqeY domain-containing protein [Acidobacteriota bacterium]
MKSREKITVNVLRMILSDLHNRKIAAGEDLDEEQIVAALRTAVKQRREAAEQFSQGGRQDRAEAELGEIEVIKAYLPKLLE